MRTPQVLDIAMIQSAADYLRGRIRPTPMEWSPGLSRLWGRPVHLKLENLQLTGSFKLRGALFKLHRLGSEARKSGVATCSAGNHGKALAYAAGKLGIRATVYVPSSIDPAKHAHMVEYGAEVVVSRFPGFDETQAWALEQCGKSGRTFVSAYDDEEIMAGNGGSLGLEILEELPSVQTLFFPVGGGGMGAGLVAALPGKTHVGCQLEASPALKLSLERGHAVTALPAVETLAGGLEGGLGARPFAHLQKGLAEVVLLSEQELWRAMRWLLEHHQYVVEASGAAPLAAALFHFEKIRSRVSGDVAIVLSGRNIALESLRRVLA